ncbi:hypothetical protein HDIA_1499 [Hartmannibacter diazotrophicus]|uniref:Phospholipid/glycerol acyltransferase domain-containing protein n=1 Tax=Hartmannibacter diazotrophicus TaxID=1482074 RepID=A0A2C9D4A0_9HYPH|nr:lysophospholipid acyltransferase family protein [Hartmannibacter diazotrophicus]SON55040.1 hypothetical protein HDIA_1499 [Hartmannibacter diazotrophicus]
MQTKTDSLAGSDISYANPDDPWARRKIIRVIEAMNGRRPLLRLYGIWRNETQADASRAFARMLELVGIDLDVRGCWPPAMSPGAPLVMIANHPFGIGDGAAILSLAEQLGRPFRVLIHEDLLKIPEMEAYSLPISFREDRQAAAVNLATRKEATRLAREGVTIVIFPAGGVATAERVFGRAEDLTWKIFCAKLVQDVGADVLPVWFEGQNSRLFHWVSRFSLTLRLAMLVGEFWRMRGGAIRAVVGPVLPWSELQTIRDRKTLLTRLQQAVFSLAPHRRVTLPNTLSEPDFNTAATAGGD